MAWVAEETFESYSDTADINGGSGGSGFAGNWYRSGGSIVCTTAAAFEGSKSASGTSAGLSSQNYQRQLSADFSGYGVIYVAMRRTSNSSGSMRWNFRSTGDSGRVSVYMASDGYIKLKSETAGTTQNIMAYSANTTYVVRISVNTSTGVATAAASAAIYGSAGSFSPECTSVSFTTGDWRYILIDLDPDGAGSGVTNYWDYLSPTSPFAYTSTIGRVRTSAGASASASSVSFSFDATQGDLLVVSAFHNGASEDSLAATYNSSSMTAVNSGTGVTGVGYVKQFYMVAPTTGVNTVQITTGGAAFTAGMAVLYAGSKQTSQPDAQTTNSATSASSITTSVTTVADNSWAVLFAAASSGTPAAGTGSTFLHASASGYGMFDSGAALTPAGSKSMQSTGSSANWRTVLASYKPNVASASASTPSLSLLGVGA